jgi:hypothetical protein
VRERSLSITIISEISTNPYYLLLRESKETIKRERERHTQKYRKLQHTF